MSNASMDIPQSGRGALGAHGGALGDYIALLKPRVMSLVLFTALTGIVAAPGTMHPVLAIAALICIGIGAGAAGALNMWYDADIDARMARTSGRPIPRGRVSPEEALTFGTVLAVGSVLCLGMMVNWNAAAMLALTIGFYVFIYTMWLKRRTPQNIVIGGAAGAFPPMVGWVAASGGIDIDSVLLFAIIFMWTPPHFWSLALTRSHEYQRVDVPMLPVVAGSGETRRQILLYSLVLAPLAVLPVFTGLGGMIYAVVSSVLGVVFLALALRVHRIRDGAPADRAARALFSYSIFYLFILFATILGEHAFGLAG